jgi:hypothetical protein
MAATMPGTRDSEVHAVYQRPVFLLNLGSGCLVLPTARTKWA